MYFRVTGGICSRCPSPGQRLALSVLVLHHRRPGAPEGAVQGPALAPLRVPAAVPEVGVVVGDVPRLQADDEGVRHLPRLAAGSLDLRGRRGPPVTSRDDMEEAVAGNERGVELHGAPVVPAQERGLVRVPRPAEVAVPFLGVRLPAAPGEHAEQAVAYPRAADKGL